MIDTRPLVAGLLILASTESCLAQAQSLAPNPLGASWLPTSLQQYNPASRTDHLLPKLKQKSSESLSSQQRYFPYRPGNTPSKSVKAKRPLKVGPCALPFMENCVVGPYASVAFSLSSNNGITSSASSTTNYSNIGGLGFGVASTSNSTFNLSSSGLAGFDIALGYDLGGIRAELNYSRASGNTNNISISGSMNDTYAVPGFPTLNSSGSAMASPISYSRQSLLLNTAIDLPTGTRFIPYFGGGIGAAWVSVGGINQQTSDLCNEVGVGTCPALLNTSSGTATALAAQAKAGISYLLNLRTIMFLEAVYDYTGSTTIGNLTLSSFNQYSGKLGVRYRF